MKHRHLFSLMPPTLMLMLLVACGNNNSSGNSSKLLAGTLTPVALAELSPTSTYSAAMGVNSTGKVIGVVENAGVMKAVTWAVDQDKRTAGAPAILSPLAGNTLSAAHGLNDSGVVVGKSQLGTETVPVVWDAGATLPTPLATLAAATSGAAYSINTAGQIVGEAEVAVGGTTHATFWNSKTGSVMDLGTLAGGSVSAAYGISEAGIIVGEANDSAGRFQAVMWQVNTSGTLTKGIQILPSPNLSDLNAVALDVNTAGNVLGEVELADGGIQVVVWNSTTLDITVMKNLGFDSSASAMNSAGIIAGWNNAGGLPLAVIIDTSKPSLYQLMLQDDATASQAYGVNDQATFTGIYGDQAMVVISN